MPYPPISKNARMPSIAEPFFLTFNATVEFRVSMTPEDLGAAGLEGHHERLAAVDLEGRLAASRANGGNPETLDLDGAELGQRADLGRDRAHPRGRADAVGSVGDGVVADGNAVQIRVSVSLAGC